MPVNRNALIRYKTIDKCLQNHYRRWTLEDLIEKCSEALYEYEGIKKGISKRTVQLDLQMMRSDKLGYNAPIIVYENKYYTYEDTDYSITNIPLTDQDLGKLSEAVEFMKQFKGFSHFRELDGMMQKLEDHVYSQKTRQKPVIDFEKNEDLKGLEYIDILYQSIIQQRAISITYQSFKARHASTFNFHPYLLKEFRNRWFLIGIKKSDGPVLNLALDRIVDINPTEETFINDDSFNTEEYFKDVIGVTVSPNLNPETVILFVTHKHAQYVITKPIHNSQKVIKKDSFGITIELQIQHNFELEKEILGLGDGIMVIEPERLKRIIMERLYNTLDLYNTSISDKGIISIHRKLTHKGYAVINRMYTRRTLRQMGSLLNRAETFDRNNEIHNLDVSDLPYLKELVVNKNLERIMSQISKELSIKEVLFHFGIPYEKYNWQQSLPECEFSMLFFLDHKTTSSFPINIIPGTHKKQLQLEQQDLIIENSIPTEYNLIPSGAILIKPLLLHRFIETKRKGKLKLLNLTFG